MIETEGFRPAWEVAAHSDQPPSWLVRPAESRLVVGLVVEVRVGPAVCYEGYLGLCQDAWSVGRYRDRDRACGAVIAAHELAEELAAYRRRGAMGGVL